MLFSDVSCGYGLFPPAKIQALSPEITNWGKEDYDDNKSRMCVCACPPVMRGDTVKHALTRTSSPPNDVPSIPWSPVVLPFWTPWGAC